MRTALSDSYAHCEKIARRSGSSFYRSFSLLGRDRRNAMTALYAFARLADDATDEVTSQSHVAVAWSAPDWHQWLDSLSSLDSDCSESTHSISPIRLALADSVSKFAIPIASLHELVRGVDTDAAQSPSGLDIPHAPPGQSKKDCPTPIRMQDWNETKTYCHRVASSVGVACLSVWAKTIGEPPSPSSIQAALDCGVAFQMTNILRDIVEDSRRNRVYIPSDELRRNGIDEDRWLSLHENPTAFALNELGDWRGLLRLQIERTKAMYESGWQVAHSISLDGQRMFSLMWHSYRQLLAVIDKAPETIWQSRIQLSPAAKLQLVGQHWFTPSFSQLLKTQNRLKKSDAPVSCHEWPNGGARIAVIGAGLAGINACMHLARHGCRVTLLESKHRIGGRVGSFVDTETGLSIDYCQHVGMKCCTALRQWIDDTDSKPFWTEQDTLHFASDNGKRIQVSAWPLPAPLHLSGLLFRWPKLGFFDRIRIGIGLLRLKRLKRHAILESQLAIDWLRANAQNDRCIQNFWGTILVSALGEQVERVTLEATHKVLIDGFASDREGYHLLVPNRPLSELLDENVTRTLVKLGVEIHHGSIVRGIVRDQSGCFELSFKGNSQPANARYDAVVIAIPWNKVSGILPADWKPKVDLASALQSSPITGIHTWWDRPWLSQPHAILVNRLCQWVFPAPEAHNATASGATHVQTKEYYYQIVISASSDLPASDTDGILKMVKQDLAEIFPESAVATLLRGCIVTDPNAVFSVSVGHESSRLDCNVLGCERVWLAGDWTATQWPATMEGALRSGATAAESVLIAFGRNAQLNEDIE